MLVHSITSSARATDWRDRHAERLGGLEVEHQFELGRLQKRQIGGLGAPENAADIDAALVVLIDRAGAVADQAAGRGVFAPAIDRGHGMARSKINERLRAGSRTARRRPRRARWRVFGQRRKSGFELAFGAGIEHHHVLPDPAGGGVQLARGGHGGEIVRVDQKRNQRGRRNQFAQKLQAFRPERGRDDGEAGEIAARPVEACNEARRNRIAAGGEDDRRGCGCHPQGAGQRRRRRRRRSPSLYARSARLPMPAVDQAGRPPSGIRS